LECDDKYAQYRTKHILYDTNCHQYGTKIPKYDIKNALWYQINTIGDQILVYNTKYYTIKLYMYNMISTYLKSDKNTCNMKPHKA
jgi:hypothetical protein